MDSRALSISYLQRYRNEMQYGEQPRTSHANNLFVIKLPIIHSRLFY